MFCPKCGNKNPDDARFCRSCRANLGNVLAVVDGELKADSGSLKPVDADEIYSTGIRNTVLGAGFLMISMLMFTIPGNSFYWLLMLLPALPLFASGVSRIVKAQALRKKKAAGYFEPSLPGNFAATQLDSGKQDYIQPVCGYATNELLKATPSVTEETTRQLEMNKEGETMTLPKK